MKNNDNKKKKIAVIVIAVVILLLVIIGSGVAIGVFRSTKGSASGRGDKKAFTNKLTTEATTLVKATTKATTEKATTEKAKKTTTKKSKKVASVSGGITTESKNDSNTKATTEKATQAPSDNSGNGDWNNPTEAPYVPDTEAPTEAPTQAPTEAPTEAPTTQHQHTWVDVTETTTERVKVKDAWDEEVEYYKCSYCGARETDVGEFHISDCGEKYYDEYFQSDRYYHADRSGGEERYSYCRICQCRIHNQRSYQGSGSEVFYLWCYKIKTGGSPLIGTTSFLCKQKTSRNWSWLSSCLRFG